MANEQTSENIDRTAKILRDKDPPPDTRPPVDVNSSLGIDQSKLERITADMAVNQREKIAAEDRVLGDVDRVQQKILPKLEQQVEHMGVEAGEMKPWNADAEAEKRRTDPITAFGSFGSVFGIIASAFTRNPMVNALNASAAAMDAIKTGDKESYERAYKAWQDNTKQALDKHKIQHDAYQDATALLSTNMTAANTKLQVLATRFGDQQMLTLLNAGMNKEVQELLASRQKLADELAMNQPKVVEANAEIQRLYALGYDPKDPQSQESQEAYKKFKQEKIDDKQAERGMTPEQSAYAKYVKENPNATADERAEYIKTLRTRGNLTPEQQALNAYIEQNPDASAEDIKKFVTEMRAQSKGTSGGGNTNLTGDRQRAADVASFRKEMKEAKNPDGSSQYTDAEIAEKAAAYEKHLKSIASAPSGNKIDDIKSRENKIAVAEHTIDQIDDMLVKHKAISGIGGKITRTGEAVGNILGSSQTDRAQFRRWVLELQEILPSIINDRSGRPLSAEASKIEGIVAGLAAGDTNANTLRAYDELRPLLKTIKKQYQERRGAGGTETNEPPAKARSWDAYPEVK